MKSAESKGKAGPALEEAGGLLTIDLSALAANWRELRKRAGTARCAAVIKADGYGLGIKPVAVKLAEAGCDVFFVATIDEARRVRAALPSVTIYVLDGLYPATAAQFRTLRAAPVLGSWPEIEEWNSFAQESGESLAAAVHFDTGMNRHGLAADDAVALADRMKTLRFKPALIMSHLACADEIGHPLTEKQIASFRQIVSQFPGIPASLANSAGLLAHKDSHFDLVRPGVSIYGGSAIKDAKNVMRPVVRLDLRIIQVRHAKKDESVGYGAIEHLKRDSRIAICAAGYADGVIRAASSSDGKRGADAIVMGKRCPVLGRISMDFMAIDVTDVAEADVKRGDFATLIGDGITVDDFAEQAGTIGYETLVSLGRRYARDYRGG
jgi:alanine racemase